jgi:hypothetical protein
MHNLKHQDIEGHSFSTEVVQCHVYFVLVPLLGPLIQLLVRISPRICQCQRLQIFLQIVRKGDIFFHPGSLIPRFKDIEKRCNFNMVNLKTELFGKDCDVPFSAADHPLFQL